LKINIHKKITSIKFSPNGKLLAAGDSSREIIVYDTDNWKEKYTELTYHASSVTDMCWSPNSTYLVSGSVDKTIIVWDFEQKKKNFNTSTSFRSKICFFC